MVNKQYFSILLATFIPFVIRSVEYISLGSYVPLIFTLIFGLLILCGLIYHKIWVTGIVKTWSVLMILFGMIRFAIEVLFYFSSIDEIHIRAQFTLWFNLTNIAYVFAGFYLYRYVNRGIGVRV